MAFYNRKTAWANMLYALLNHLILLNCLKVRGQTKFGFLSYIHCMLQFIIFQFVVCEVSLIKIRYVFVKKYTEILRTSFSTD